MGGERRNQRLGSYFRIILVQVLFFKWLMAADYFVYFTCKILYIASNLNVTEKRQRDSVASTAFHHIVLPTCVFLLFGRVLGPPAFCAVCAPVLLMAHTCTPSAVATDQRAFFKLLFFILFVFALSLSAVVNSPLFLLSQI